VAMMGGDFEAIHTPAAAGAIHPWLCPNAGRNNVIHTSEVPFPSAALRWRSVLITRQRSKLYEVACRPSKAAVELVPCRHARYAC
jgi:hypothetical protein